MFDSVLWRMRGLVGTWQYVMTLHAVAEMDDDELDILDVEAVILEGQIVRRERDAVTAEWKYVIEGRALSGDDVAVVAKIGPSGRLVIITVYLID